MTVISGADAEIPVDTAEVSATLNNELVDSATLTGRNAAELIKMMPGVTFNNVGGAWIRLQQPGHRHQQRSGRQLLGQRHTALRLNGSHPRRRHT